jgi:hypothetical protein
MAAMTLDGLLILSSNVDGFVIAVVVLVPSPMVALLFFLIVILAGSRPAINHTALIVVVLFWLGLRFGLAPWDDSIVLWSDCLVSGYHRLVVVLHFYYVVMFNDFVGRLLPLPSNNDLLRSNSLLNNDLLWGLDALTDYDWSWSWLREELGRFGVFLQIWALRWANISISVNFSYDADLLDFGRRRARVAVSCSYMDIFLSKVVSTFSSTGLSLPWVSAVSLTFSFDDAILDPRVPLIATVIFTGVSSLANDKSGSGILVLIKVFWNLVSSHGGEGARVAAACLSRLCIPLALLDSDIGHGGGYKWGLHCARLRERLIKGALRRLS